MKEDRNILRTALKDANDELLILFRKHKKKLELSSLQIELRKIVNKIKGKTPSQTSLPQSQQNVEKKPKSTKSKEKPPEILIKEKQSEKPIIEKSPEKIPQILTETSGQKSNEIKRGERSVEKPEKREVNEKKLNEKKTEKVETKLVKNEQLKEKTEKNKEKTESIQLKPEKLTNPKNEENNLINKMENLLAEEQKNGLITEKKLEEKKPKNVKKMDQIDEVIKHHDDKYETPSFKNQPQGTFRSDKPKKNDENISAISEIKVKEKTLEPRLIPHQIQINPNEKAQIFLENTKDFVEKQVDDLLNLKEVSEFSGRKIEVFKEDDRFNLADFSLPTEIQQEENSSSKKEEKTKKATESIDVKVQNDKIMNQNMISPVKSDSVQSQRNFLLRPSVLKTLKFITEKPSFNPKVVNEIQKIFGFREFAPEFVFDKIIGEVHLSRTSKTYFKYKIEVGY